MKKFLAYAFLLAGGLFLLPSFSSEPAAPVEVAAFKLKYPKKVDALIKDKCYGCHSPNARFDKSKNALNWDNLTSMSGSDLAHELGEIQEVVEKGSMPPAQFLQNNPDKKLTDAEAMLLKKWAMKAAKKAAK